MLRHLFGAYPGAVGWHLWSDEPAAALAERLCASAGCEYYMVDGETFGPFHVC